MRVWTAEETGARCLPEYRHMVQERPAMRTGMLGIAAGGHVRHHVHEHSEELFFVVAGSATFTVGEAKIELGPGDILVLDPGEHHYIDVHDEPLRILAVVAPNLDDTVFFEE